MKWAAMTVNFTTIAVAVVVVTSRLLQLLTGTRDAHLRQPFKTRLHGVHFIHPPPPPFISLAWGLREERSLSTCSILSWYVFSFTAITSSPRPKPKQCSEGRGGSLLWQTPSTHKESSTTHYFFHCHLWVRYRMKSLHRQDLVQSNFLTPIIKGGNIKIQMNSN